VIDGYAISDNLCICSYWGNSYLHNSRREYFLLKWRMDPVPSPGENVKTDKASYERPAIPSIYCDVHNSYSKFDAIFRDHFLRAVYLLLYWRTGKSDY